MCELINDPSDAESDAVATIERFLKPHLSCRDASVGPIFIGVNGPQGIGKSTLVKQLASLTEQRYDCSALVLSLDDFYLTRAEQVALARAHPDNPFLQHRGVPGELNGSSVCLAHEDESAKLMNYRHT